MDSDLQYQEGPLQNILKDSEKRFESLKAIVGSASEIHLTSEPMNDFLGQSYME